MHHRNPAERLLEALLFHSRWLLAPFYLGLVVSLIMLLTAFVGELWHFLGHLLAATPEDISWPCCR